MGNENKVKSFGGNFERDGTLKKKERDEEEDVPRGTFNTVHPARTSDVSGAQSQMKNDREGNKRKQQHKAQWTGPYTSSNHEQRERVYRSRCAPRLIFHWQQQMSSDKERRREMLEQNIREADIKEAEKSTFTRHGARGNILCVCVCVNINYVRDSTVTKFCSVVKLANKFPHL